MTEKASVSQEQVPQTPQVHEPQSPEPHKARNCATSVWHKRRRSHRKEVREWITAIVQLAGVVAVVVSLVGLIVNIQQYNQQQQAADRNTLDQRRQATLDNYIDQMSTLLLQYNLAHSKSGDPVQAVAQARTLTALRNLDSSREATLIRFLWEANLINGSHPIIVLNQAYIPSVSLRLVYLGEVNLNQAFLKYADFYDSDLHNADFGGARLDYSNLGVANLRGATLAGTNLTGANLAGADLTGANLSAAILTNVNLSGKDTDLTGANLTNANLTGVNLAGANLTKVNLTGANLKGANLSGATLTGATMPDGSKHP